MNTTIRIKNSIGESFPAEFGSEMILEKIKKEIEIYLESEKVTVSEDLLTEIIYNLNHLAGRPRKTKEYMGFEDNVYQIEIVENGIISKIEFSLHIKKGSNEKRWLLPWESCVRKLIIVFDEKTFFKSQITVR